MKHFIGARDLKERRESRAATQRALSGAEQRIARDPELISWLSKVYGELQAQSREWPMFNAKQLGSFLFAVLGPALEEAVKAHEDAMPIPEEIATPELCWGKLRGASFLNLPAEAACARLNDRAKRSLMRS